MTSYDASPSIEVFRVRNHDVVGVCDNSDSNHGLCSHQSPIAMVSSFDLESIRSHPGITANTSMTSFTTQWSTVTAHASNTTKRHSEKKHKKRKFHHFVKILMGIVKEKDEGKFQNAKAIIRSCQQQKRRGKIQSLSESLPCPLKDAVGPQFWGEARQRLLSQALLHSKTKRSSIGASIESVIYVPDTISSFQYKEEVHSRSPEVVESNENAKYNVTKANIKEARTRKKRLWMVIRVFMQYLGSTNSQLYRKAHTLVNECVRQHKKIHHFEHRNSLSGSIQTCLKKEFGLEHWKRAEYFVAESLLSRREDRRRGESR